MSLNSSTDPAILEIIQTLSDAIQQCYRENTVRDEIIHELVQERANTREQLRQSEYRLGNAEHELVITQKQLKDTQHQVRHSKNTQHQVQHLKQHVKHLDMEYKKEILDIRSHLPDPNKYPSAMRFQTPSNNTIIPFTIAERFKLIRHFVSRCDELEGKYNTSIADGDQRMQEMVVNTMTSMLEPIEKKVDEMNTRKDSATEGKLKAFEYFADDVIADRQLYKSFEYYDQWANTGRQTRDRDARKLKEAPAQSQPPPVVQNTPAQQQQYPLPHGQYIPPIPPRGQYFPPPPPPGQYFPPPAPHGAYPPPGGYYPPPGGYGWHP